ncbi:hypothetical protein SDC9_152308 [bioreactor metagenome]|uniref:Uncharacterized protein n=1 Tax=bioreactor metagenome TaxID=1076179 RepID=A0A645ESQ8_9ZZZZ
MAGKGFAGVIQHALDQTQQLFFVERLLDEVQCAFLHGVHSHGHIAVTGDEDDGQRRLALDQTVLQFQTGHAAHADVNDQTGDFTRVVAGQKRFSRIKATHTVVFAFQQPLQGITYRFVVVYDVDGAFFRDQTHSIVLGVGVATDSVVASAVVFSGSQKENRHPVTSVPL